MEERKTDGVSLCMGESVVVPVEDIAAIERARVALLEMGEGADIVTKLQLQYHTSDLWRLTHRRYPRAR